MNNPSQQLNILWASAVSGCTAWLAAGRCTLLNQVLPSSEAAQPAAETRSLHLPHTEANVTAYSLLQCNQSLPSSFLPSYPFPAM